METIEKTIAAKVKVIKEEPCEITFSVELPSDEVTKETDSVYQNIKSRASLPGFRTGKAPMELIRQNFTDRARQTILENLVGKAATQVLRERKIQTLDTPKVEKIDFEFGKPLSFEMKVEKDPEIKLKDYKGLKATKAAVAVTNEMVTKTLDDLRERNATLVASADTKVGAGHFAVIDFEGKIEGKAFPGGSAKNYLLDMAAPQTIAGFSDGLAGATLAEKKTIQVRFPADYPRKEWAGKEAVFEVTVKEIKEKKLPAGDDEFAKDLGLGSLAELQEKIRQNLEKEETNRAEKDFEEQLYQALLDKHALSVPTTLVEERVNTLSQRALGNLERQGLIVKGDAQAEKTVREKSRPQAEKDVRLSYLLKAIAEAEKLDATEEDLATLKKQAAEENKDHPEAVDKYFIEHNVALRASLTEGKVLEFLKKNAKVKPA